MDLQSLKLRAVMGNTLQKSQFRARAEDQPRTIGGNGAGMETPMVQIILAATILILGALVLGNARFRTLANANST
jgi:hypothetical protein